MALTGTETLEVLGQSSTGIPASSPFITTTQEIADLGSGSVTSMFNITDYGALLDGVTNDAAALVAARAAAIAAGGGKVYIPYTAAGCLLASATVMNGGDVWIEGDPRRTRLICPRTTGVSVSATALNIDFTADFLGPYAITEIVQSMGYDHTSTGVNSLTLSSANTAVYNNGTLRLDRNSATRFDLIIDGTTLLNGFDFTFFAFQTGSGGARIQGDGVTNVSVDGAANDPAAVVNLVDEQGVFIKIVAGVITIKTNIRAILNGSDVVSRIELTAADAANFAYGDAMNIDTDLEADCSASGDRVYEKNGEFVQGVNIAAAGYVYLSSLLDINLNSATTKNARKYSNNRVVFKNFDIVGQGNVEVDSLAGSSKAAIMFSGIRNIQIDNIGVRDIWNFGYQLRNCFFGHINDIYCDYARNSGELGAEQYVITTYGFNKYLYFTRFHTNGARHVFTTQNPQDSSWSGSTTSWPGHGETIYCLFDGGELLNTNGNSIDTHKIGRKNTYQNFRIVGCNRWLYGTIIPKGLQHRCGSATYRNCTFEDMLNCITMDINISRDLPNEVVFELCTFGGAREANTTPSSGTSAVTRRAVELTGSVSHTAQQTIRFRKCVFKGDTNRLMDLDGNYVIYLQENDFSQVNVLNGGFLIEFDGDVWSTYRNKIIVENNRFDTSGYASAITGLIRVNGTIDVELGPNDVRGTNYSAVVASSGAVDITLKRYGKITQHDQRREIASGTFTSNVDVDPRVVVVSAAVGNVGAGTDNLQSYALPSRSIQEAGDMLIIEAWGTYANNANAKTVALLFGGTTLLSESLTTSQSGTWRFRSRVIATAASAQDYMISFAQEGTVKATDAAVSTATETSTAAITIKCTGAATSDNDIVQEGMTIELVKG